MPVLRPIAAARRARSARGFKAVATAGAATMLLATVASGVSDASPRAAQTSSSSTPPPARMLPASITKSGVLTDGVNLPNPPLEYQANGTGAYTGFDIELGRALAAKLGLSYSPRTSPSRPCSPASTQAGSTSSCPACVDTTARQGRVHSSIT